MHKSATKCNKTLGKWCKNKHEASKIIDMFWTYHWTNGLGAIGCILLVMNFDYIVDKINIDYSHRELFMRVAKDNSDILYVETVKQGCEI
jgi:hypothetical protein